MYPGGSPLASHRKLSDGRGPQMPRLLVTSNYFTGSKLRRGRRVSSIQAKFVAGPVRELQEVTWGELKPAMCHHVPTNKTTTSTVSASRP
jgi:hypothetical protein